MLWFITYFNEKEKLLFYKFFVLFMKFNIIILENWFNIKKS